jgi:hypothetical protein
MYQNIGKLCQKGTYSTDFNSNVTCEACPYGITTAAEGSTSAAACSFAQKGFYINPENAAEALECPVDTYQDQEANVTACTACPNGWKTEEGGATGEMLCLAPSGFELAEGAANISACAVGFCKEGWNRNPCVPVSCQVVFFRVAVCHSGAAVSATSSSSSRVVG